MRQFVQILTALFVIGSAHAVLAQNYNPCSNPVQANWCDAAPAGSDITILSVTLSPNPIVKGQTVDLTIMSLDSKTYSITQAQYSLVVKFDGVPMINLSGVAKCPELGDLVSLLNGSTTCPVPPFTQKVVSYSFVVPKFLPSGAYSGEFALVDQNGKAIQAIQFDMPIK